MQIRTRLTLQFLLIGGTIMVIASFAVYFFSAEFRREDFYNRLESKAVNVARLLVDVDEIDLNLLKKIEADNPVKLPEEKIIIMNYNNDTLYTSDETGEIKIKMGLNDRIRLQGTIKYKQDKYEVLGLHYTDRFDKIVVIAAAVDVDGLVKQENLRAILFIVCFISFILFIAGGWLFAGKALKPISGVVGQVEDISIASLNLRVDEGNGTDELAMLARTFNKMLDRLEISFNLQKDFISNASHELRTPLTAVHGQLEVLLMKDRTTEEYKSTISSVLEDIRNLTDLSNRLLLLAQTSSDKQILGRNRISLDELLWQIKEEFRKFHKPYNINISISPSLTESEQMEIRGDEFLLKTAFSNIIDNACKFSDNHSVDINIDRCDNRLIILFKDKGIGISEQDLKHVLEPFHRAYNSNVPGHGIGLSLVNQIMKKHNGEISISSVEGQGTTVNLQFPIA